MRISVVTTGRADYGLLYPLILELEQADWCALSLIATGAHLSSLHGTTIDFIRADGIDIADVVEMPLADDTEHGLCLAVADGLAGFSEYFKKKTTDLLLVLGDRYELWAPCMAAVIHKIPIAHIHGGESTSGLIDDPIRHSVTKMASFHFASMEAYAKRIIQMGERPDRVHVVGALGIDNIRAMQFMDARSLSEYAGVDFEHDRVALMTYHPVTLDDPALAATQTQIIMDALEQTDLAVLVTMPNADTGGAAIHETIGAYANKNPKRFRLVKNLGQRAYLSAMKHAALMIGNSSSGILESASFRLPVVNIGDRQGGRIRPKNVIDCTCSFKAIANAVNRALSDPFISAIGTMENPYGDGHAAERIARILSKIDLADKTALLKKGFYDIVYACTRDTTPGASL